MEPEMQMVHAAERLLAMSAGGRRCWCVHWAKWLWAQEVEIAIHQAKQDRT